MGVGTPLGQNPFSNRGMIRMEDGFIGRSREIRDIVNRIRTSNSVSIIGERRIGKSSLVYHLFLTGNKRLNDVEERKYKFLYLDFHGSQLKTPQLFSEKVLNELDIAYDEKQLQVKPLVVLTRQLEAFRKDGKPCPILLLDEFEQIVQHPELFNDLFLEALRSLSNSGVLTMVTVTHHSLKDLTTRGNLTSPFWNIFVSRPLGEFRVEGSLNEVQEFLEKTWMQPHLGIQEYERKIFQRYKTRHPLKLQVVSYWLFENRQYKYSDKRLRREINLELKSYFRTWAEESQRGVYKIPYLFAQLTRWTGQRVKDLGSVFSLLGFGK